MSVFGRLADMPPLPIWEGVLARVVEGRDLTFAIVELDPNAVVARHQHSNEQIGIVLKGSMRFNIGGESREIGAGDTYNIPANLAHDAAAGPDGAVVIDVFAPTRADWRRFAPGTPCPPRWP